MSNDRCHYCGYPRRAMIHMDTWWGGHRYRQAPDTVREVAACLLFGALVLVLVVVGSLAVLTMQGGGR